MIDRNDIMSLVWYNNSLQCNHITIQKCEQASKQTNPRWKPQRLGKEGFLSSLKEEIDVENQHNVTFY
jgi:hypothetical protein